MTKYNLEEAGHIIATEDLESLIEDSFGGEIADEQLKELWEELDIAYINMLEYISENVEVTEDGDPDAIYVGKII